MAFTPGRMNRFGRGCFRNHTTIKVWWGGEGEVRGRWQAQRGVDGEEGERKNECNDTTTFAGALPTFTSSTFSSSPSSSSSSSVVVSPCFSSSPSSSASPLPGYLLEGGGGWTERTHCRMFEPRTEALETPLARK